MTRTFYIHDSPNKQGFARFIVKTDNGKPYMENDPEITTSSELRLIERLIQWIREAKND